MVIYCDSCIPIYYFDHTGPLNIRAAHRLAVFAAAGDLIAASDLVRLECRVKPISVGDAAKLAVFDAFFTRPDVRLVPMTPHTAAFWNQVDKVMPDFQERKEWLRDNGAGMDLQVKVDGQAVPRFRCVGGQE